MWTVEAINEFQKKIKEWVLSVVPKKTSELTNDSGFAKTSDIPSTYVKSASTSTDGKTLTLTKQDDTSVTFQGGGIQQVLHDGTLEGDGASDATQLKAKAMSGATSTSAGTAGIVPAPAAGDEDKLLSGAGTWVDKPDGKTYTAGDNIEISEDNRVSVTGKKDLAVDTDTMSAEDKGGAIVLGVKSDAFVAGGQGISRIVRVTQLPEDAADHPDTMYVVIKES